MIRGMREPGDLGCDADPFRQRIEEPFADVRGSADAVHEAGLRKPWDTERG